MQMELGYGCESFQLSSICRLLDASVCLTPSINFERSNLLFSTASDLVAITGDCLVFGIAKATGDPVATDRIPMTG